MDAIVEGFCKMSMYDSVFVQINSKDPRQKQNKIFNFLLM